MNVLAVGIGGIFGALARYGLSLALNPASTGQFPWGTLICNLAGCLLLGWFSFVASKRLPPRLRLAVTTGFIGAFTTFSTFSLDMVHLLQSHERMVALVYLLLSFWGGLAFVWAGSKLAAGVSKRQNPEGEGA
jgi:CrcB protein